MHKNKRNTLLVSEGLVLSVSFAAYVDKDKCQQLSKNLISVSNPIDFNKNIPPIPPWSDGVVLTFFPVEIVAFVLDKNKVIIPNIQLELFYSASSYICKANLTSKQQIELFYF